MEYLSRVTSGVTNYFSVDPIGAISQTARVGGILGAGVSVAHGLLQLKAGNRAITVRDNAESARAALCPSTPTGDPDEIIAFVDKTPIQLSGEGGDRKPVKRSIRHLSELLAKYNEPGHEALQNYRQEISRVVNAITAREGEVRSELVTLLQALHAAIGEGDELKGKVNTLLNEARKPNLTSGQLQDLLGRVDEHNNLKGDPDGSLLGLCRTCPHNFPAEDQLDAASIEGVIQHHKGQLMSANIEMGKRSNVREAIDRLFRVNGDDLPLKLALEGLQKAVEKATPVAEKMEIWNDYSLLQKVVYSGSSESPIGSSVRGFALSIGLLLAVRIVDWMRAPALVPAPVVTPGCPPVEVHCHCPV